MAAPTIDTTAAAMAGVAVASVAMGLFRAPLWGGILLGAATAFGTKMAIEKASLDAQAASAAAPSSATPSA